MEGCLVSHQKPWRRVHSIFQVLKGETMNSEPYSQGKCASGMREIKTSLSEGIKRKYHQHTNPKRMTNESFLNRKKKNSKGRNLDHQEERRNTANILINTIDFFSPLVFSKLFLMVKA